ncbi:MAG: transposase [Acetobacteraceae bacterium]|nr:transposase [Acetobacteraceae bacterium]
MRDWLRARRVEAVIPSNAARHKPYPLDRRTHRRRNVVERPICRLKNWRRTPPATTASRPTISPPSPSSQLSPNGPN